MVYNLSKPGERGFCTITIHTVCKENCVVLEEVHTILLSSTVRKTKERRKLGGRGGDLDLNKMKV